MAEVQLARLRGAMGFEKLVVVKLVHEHLASQKSFVEMLMQEARLAALVKHPNVVDIYDLGESEGRYFVAMEYLAGEPMLALLRAGRDGKRLDPLSTGRLIAEVAEGLTAAHQLRTMAGEPMPLVHHDISLGNIMVLYTGQAKLVDFGVAKAGDVAQDDKDRIKGKFGYMAPEKLRGEGGDARSDLFSLGVVLWEALTLRRLFRADTDLEAIAQVLEDPIAPPSQINGEVPKAFDAICAKALERTVDRRYQTAAEMAHDIESVLKDASYSGKYEVIAAYMQKTFADHICARSQLIKEASTLHGPSQQLVSAAYDSDAMSDKSDPAMTRPPLEPPPALLAPAPPLTPLAPIPPASAAAEAVRGRLVKKGQAKVAGASGTGAGTGNDGDGDEATTQQPLIDADSPEAGGARQTGAMAVARAASSAGSSIGGSIGSSIGSSMRRDVAAAMAAAAESTATEVIHESVLRASTATSVTSVKATQPMAFVAAPLSRASGTGAETDDGSDDVSVAVSSAAPSDAPRAAPNAAKASASSAPAEAPATAPASAAASALSANRTEETAAIPEQADAPAKADAPADAAAKAAAGSGEAAGAAAPASSAAKDAAPAPSSAAAAGSPSSRASAAAAAAGAPAAEGAALGASPTSSKPATPATATTAPAAGATEPATAAAAADAPADRKPLPGQATPTVTEVNVPAPPVLPSVTAAATVQTPTVMWADQEPSVTELSPQWPSGEVSLTEVSAPRSAAKSLIPSIPKILPAKARLFSEESEATEVSASPIVLGEEASAAGPRNSAKAASPSAALRASGREQRGDNGGPPPGLSELLAMVKPGTASMSASKPPLGNVLSEVSGDLSASGTLAGPDSSGGAAHGAAAVENGDPAGAGWGWNGAGAELSAEELGHARRLAALRRKTRWMVGGGVGLIALVAIVALATGGSGPSGTGALGVRGAGAGRLGGSGATEPGSATASAAAGTGDPQPADAEPTGDDSTFPGATRPDQIALAPEVVPAAAAPAAAAPADAAPADAPRPAGLAGLAAKQPAPDDKLAALGTPDDLPGEVAEPRPVTKPAKAGAAPERRDDDRDDRKKPELDVEATFKAGQSEFLRGDSKAALATFRKVLTASPSYAPAWRGSALALERLGQKPAAAKALRRYLKLAPNAGDAAQIKARLERLE